MLLLLAGDARKVGARARAKDTTGATDDALAVACACAPRGGAQSVPARALGGGATDNAAAVARAPRGAQSVPARALGGSPSALLPLEGVLAGAADPGFA